MIFLRAHGAATVPRDHIFLQGIVSGLLAALPAIGVMAWSGVLAQAPARTGLAPWLFVLIALLVFGLTGGLYGLLFRRAAADHRAGWLFGMSFGFLVWMALPATVAKWAAGGPRALGVAASGLAASCLLFGLVLGLAFPFVHVLLRPQWPPKDG